MTRGRNNGVTSHAAELAFAGAALIGAAVAVAAAAGHFSAGQDTVVASGADVSPLLPSPASPTHGWPPAAGAASPLAPPAASAPSALLVSGVDDGPGQAGDADEPGGADPSGHPPLAGTERGYYEGFVVIARSDPRRFERLAEEIVRGESTDAERVAALRALHDARCERWHEVFALAIACRPDTSGPAGESVPAFAVGVLGREAAADPLARSVLASVARLPSGGVSDSLRRRAAAALAEAEGATAEGATVEGAAAGAGVPDAAALAADPAHPAGEGDS